jgi:sporulation protein YqfC
MGRTKYILSRLADGADLGEEPLPGQSLVEIAGDRRLLIENHCGVKEYSRERIGVKVKFGQINVCGSCLELRHMTRHQLLISGRIDAVTLCRRG